MADALVLSIDQWTTSSRALAIDREGEIRGLAQKEFRQIFPADGWVEHDPREIWRNTHAVMREGLAQADLEPRDLAAIGLTNQRETALLWDRRTGEPLHHALVWQDTRTDRQVAALARDGGRDRFRGVTGLPLASYFSASKLAFADSMAAFSF